MNGRVVGVMVVVVLNSIARDVKYLVNPCSHGARTKLPTVELSASCNYCGTRRNVCT